MTGDVHIIKVDSTMNNNNAKTSVDQVKLDQDDKLSKEDNQNEAGI